MSRRDLGGDGDLTAVRVVGSAVPADVVARLADPKGDLPGRSGDDYDLELGVSPVEAANRAWSVLVGAWSGYRAALARLPEGDRATALTREKWLLVVLRELGFGRVPSSPAGGLVVEERSFPVSHLAGSVPVHLLGREVELDAKTPGLAGAAERAPHAMVQELLNRSDDHLWAILANDTKLRLLRDSSTLVGQSFVEFDLAAIFDGELFADFTALYLLCHHSRFQPTDDTGMVGCWLERWRTHAAETGARALGALRDGVKAAIEALGSGFVAHPANGELRDRLADGSLELADLHRSLLRLVYRLLFVFVAEDRGLLLVPDASDVARARYRDWFSTARLRHVARRRRGSGHDDRWQALRLVLDGLGDEAGRPELGLPGLGGIFEHGPVDVVTACSLTNRSLIAAVGHLSVIRPAGGGPRRVVDYRNLGAEELGGIYESLLEFVPRHDPFQRTFTLDLLPGNDRKKSGAYYTPSSLIDCLLDSALDPLLDLAEVHPDPEGALLALTVCDPACGSGHFLVAAAKRIAHRLARVRAGGAEPTVDQSQAAMHDVVGHCIYGVDVNPMATELAKVSLWLESLARGRALGFLDAHLKTGNALLGTTPALLAAGIPDDAYAALEGDDRTVVSSLKKRNKAERAGADELFPAAGPVPSDHRALADEARRIDALGGLSLADIHLARRRQREFDHSPEAQRSRLLADAWCAAFLAPKGPADPPITQAVLDAWAQAAPPADDSIRAAVERVAAEYHLFHWHLEFPQIFEADPAAGGPGWRGGFACVLGNPPWERVKLQEQEFFAARDERIAAAPTAASRKRLIQALAATNPTLDREFRDAKRHAEGESHLLRSSGRYPLNGRGDINTYAVFAEHDRTVLGPTGRLGVILPTGIATDATTQHFFKDLVQQRSLASLYDFENRLPLFEAVDSRFKFCLLTLSGADTPIEAADFAFFAHRPADLARDGVRFPLTAAEIELLNPNTGTCPVFRSRRDAELTLAIYRRVPVLVKHGDPDGNPWGVTFSTMFHMSNDSHLFHTREELEADGWTLNGNVFEKAVDEPAGGGGVTVEQFLPLYEAKMLHLFDTRWATYEPDGSVRRMTETEKADHLRPLPRYWVAAAEIDRKLRGRWERTWFLGWRDIARSTDERTVIATLLPYVGIGNKVPLMLVDAPLSEVTLLQAALSSFVQDFAARQKIGGTTLNYFLVEQLPVPVPGTRLGHLESDWLSTRVDCLNGWIVDPDERALVRAEVDAYCFHLYGLTSTEVAEVMDTFPIVERNDLATHGTYRTKDLVLAAYDAIAPESTEP